MSRIQIKALAETNNQLLWSIVIPTFNCASFLSKTIQSVIDQNIGEEKMEIIVVDDCSTLDDPERVVNETGKGRVKFLRQKQNVGQVNNFETCLNVTKGKFIHLLHGDDMILPGFYKQLEKPLLSDAKIGAAYTRHFFIDENDKIIASSDIVSDKAGVVPDFLYLIASKQIIQTPSIVVKREVYETIGAFDKSLSWCEDWEMWVRIASNYKFYYEPQTLACYRMHTNSNTGSAHTTGRFITDVLKAIHVYSAYIPLHKKVKKQAIANAKKHFLEYSLSRIGKFLKDSNNKKATNRILIKTFLLAPDVQSFIKICKRLIRINLK